MPEMELAGSVLTGAESAASRFAQFFAGSAASTADANALFEEAAEEALEKFCGDGWTAVCAKTGYAAEHADSNIAAVAQRPRTRILASPDRGTGAACLG